MTSGVQTVIYPVKNLAQAKALFSELLGAAPSVDGEYYVQFEVAGQDIGLDPNGHGKGMTGPVGYWHVDDVNDSVKRMLDAGAQVEQPVSDVGGGKLVGSVKDPDGNIIGLIQTT